MKKSLAILLALMLAATVLFCACGDKEEDPANTTDAGVTDAGGDETDAPADSGTETTDEGEKPGDESKPADTQQQGKDNENSADDEFSKRY